MTKEKLNQSDELNQSVDTTQSGLSNACIATNRFNLHPLIYAMLALISIFIFYQIVGSGLTVLLFGLDFTDNNVQMIRLATAIGQILFLLIPTLIFLRFQSRNIFQFVRFKPISFPAAVYIIIGVIAAQQFLQGYLFFQEMIPIPEAIEPFVENLRKSIEQMYRVLVMVDTIPELLFVILIVALIPAFSEEFLFRGLVQRNFEYSFGLAGGAVVTGIIFALYHLNPFTLLPLMVLGIVFGLLVYKTGSILAAILAHFINNLFAVLSVYYRREEIFLSDKADPSVITILLVMFISGSIAVACWVLLSRTVAEKKKQDTESEITFKGV
jgi:uncharacterized protein